LEPLRVIDFLSRVSPAIAVTTQIASETKEPDSLFG